MLRETRMDCEESSPMADLPLELIQAILQWTDWASQCRYFIAISGDKRYHHIYLGLKHDWKNPVPILVPPVASDDPEYLNLEFLPFFEGLKLAVATDGNEYKCLDALMDGIVPRRLNDLPSSRVEKVVCYNAFMFQAISHLSKLSLIDAELPDVIDLQTMSQLTEIEVSAVREQEHYYRMLLPSQVLTLVCHWYRVTVEWTPTQVTNLSIHEGEITNINELLPHLWSTIEVFEYQLAVETPMTHTVSSSETLPIKSVICDYPLSFTDVKTPNLRVYEIRFGTGVDATTLLTRDQWDNLSLVEMGDISVPPDWLEPKSVFATAWEACDEGTLKEFDQMEHVVTDASFAFSWPVNTLFLKDFGQKLSALRLAFNQEDVGVIDLAIPTLQVLDLGNDQNCYASRVSINCPNLEELGWFYITLRDWTEGSLSCPKLHTVVVEYSQKFPISLIPQSVEHLTVSHMWDDPMPLRMIGTHISNWSFTGDCVTLHSDAVDESLLKRCYLLAKMIGLDCFKALDCTFDISEVDLQDVSLHNCRFVNTKKIKWGTALGSIDLTEVELPVLLEVIVLSQDDEEASSSHFKCAPTTFSKLSNLTSLSLWRVDLKMPAEAPLKLPTLLRRMSFVENFVDEIHWDLDTASHLRMVSLVGCRNHDDGPSVYTFELLGCPMRLEYLDADYPPITNDEDKAKYHARLNDPAGPNYTISDEEYVKIAALFPNLMKALTLGSLVYKL